MKIAFNELPYYQDFLLSDDLARRSQIVRDYCQILLRISDWTVMEYAPTDKPAWLAYREAVRECAQAYDPTNDNPVFPIEPEMITIQPIGDSNGN